MPLNQNCRTYAFHYAPYYADSYRQRAVILSNWVAQTNPTAVIVDVSAEITQYLRFLGVPVIAMRQHGDRSDYPHLAGYDAAYKLFAPYPQILECGSMPSWIQSKTIYSSGFSRYSGRILDKSTARKQLNIPADRQVVLVLNGKGGGKYSLAQIAKAATATPDWLWIVVGKVSQDCQSLPDNICVKGWCDDTYVYLKAADIAIASGGHNTVMEIGTAKVPFVCIPESRPFDEQKIKARRLQELGLCMVLESFPSGSTVNEVFLQLKQLDLSKWDKIMAADGAVEAAKAIESEVKLLDKYLTSVHYNPVFHNS